MHGDSLKEKLIKLRGKNRYVTTGEKGDSICRKEIILEVVDAIINDMEGNPEPLDTLICDSQAKG